MRSGGRRGLEVRHRDGVEDVGDEALEVRLDHAVRLRSDVNNSLIIVNFFHKIQNFWQISDLFSQI